VPTPAFIPVGSQGTVKSLTPEELESLGVKILLGNTYHLYLRPGVEIIEKLGGLHRFISWEGTIVTDSGGYQLFSLASLRRISEEGVLFRSHIDGSQHFFTPESIIEFQERLGADIILPLDECPPYCAEKETVRESMLRTHRWAERCQRSHKKETQALYAIVQGGIFPELRRESAQFLTSLGFCGYALGGLSLGEPREKMLAVVEETVAYLPGDKPRYLLGVGSPEELVEAISRGIDLFDSALPTRVARNGALFTAQGRRNIRNASFRTWEGPVDIDCDCYTCRHFSAAYLHHLFRCEELLAYRLATFHNLHFIIRLMERARRSIEEGEFPRFKRDFLDGYQSTDEETRLNQKRKWLESSRKGEKRNYEIDV
jgi:queuine tRNA-ribosyltransferase